MSQPTIKEVLLNPIFNNNPIGLQILGICSALAVTSNLKTALVMSLALTVKLLSDPDNPLTVMLRGG